MIWNFRNLDCVDRPKFALAVFGALDRNHRFAGVVILIRAISGMATKMCGHVADQKLTRRREYAFPRFEIEPEVTTIGAVAILQAKELAVVF